jgi:alpha-L-fucosidase
MTKARVVVYFFLVSLVSAALSSLAFAEEKASPMQETPQQRDARMAWFRDARFGLFIHWGIYSVPGSVWKDKQAPGYSEWIMDKLQIPVSEYEKFREFNPVKFDAKQWVQIAKDAGVKYIVITSKHHDGFAMYDTKLTDWGIMSTPWKHDPMKDLAEECRKAGIKFCFYHSIMDWHHPDYAPRHSTNDKAKGEPNFERYVEFMKGQLKELVTNYGPLGILWFDGEWESTWSQPRGKDLYAYVRGLQPDIIINNRVGKDRQGEKKEGDLVGDYGTPEQEVPPEGLPGVDWESCITMNDSWGYSRIDNHWKSTAELIRMLIDIASKGGNLLLNVGPSPEGQIPEPSVERLAAIGRWMRVNGESIYGSTASPYAKTPAWGRATQKPGKVFLHVFNWPTDGKLIVPPIKGIKVASAALLADGSSLPFGATAEGITIDVPAQAPDAVASVIVLGVAPQ